MNGHEHRALLFVASGGGHLVELCLLVEALQQENIGPGILVTSGAIPSDAPKFSDVRHCTDCSRESPFRVIQCLFEVYRIMREVDPGVVVTTGAAPGLLAVLVARIRGIPAVWLESLANVKTLSLSGRLARRIGVQVVSQWPDLAARHGVSYWGRVL